MNTHDSSLLLTLSIFLRSLKAQRLNWVLNFPNSSSEILIKRIPSNSNNIFTVFVLRLLYGYSVLTHIRHFHLDFYTIKIIHNILCGVIRVDLNFALTLFMQHSVNFFLVIFFSKCLFRRIMDDFAICYSV
ncbi:hypothetical protein C447_00175 [Halococcus hamelinensis 100A6]|uniref:Uncharacterized protein n=1 Tax=Halococcus hamelinensis 100A6 TaxID=1132509 RepID=M0MBE5_9EURY|nr:hypothetical protein C447_00175 [Halococcus hamelinensis 100A6]